MPCALNASCLRWRRRSRVAGGARSAAATARCASLQAAGILKPGTPAQQAEQARALLNAGGWTDEALAAGALSTSFDLWRAVAVTYAASYTRASATRHALRLFLPGHGCQGTGARARRRRAGGLVERFVGHSARRRRRYRRHAGRRRRSFAAGPALPARTVVRTRRSSPIACGPASPKPAPDCRADGLPVLVIHGADDGLVPEAFSGGAYARVGQGGRARRALLESRQRPAFRRLPGPAGIGCELRADAALRAIARLDAMWSHLSPASRCRAKPGSATTKAALPAPPAWRR